jgi:PIN domain nuclease of toxin-antitoxin system
MLLDTHALIWYLTDDPQLPPSLKERITWSPLVYISAAVIWEIAIKGALGKLTLGGKPVDSYDAVKRIIVECEAQQLELLPISPAEAAQAPFLPGVHKDPFDRLLAAQALQKALPLVSQDKVFDNLALAIRRVWTDDATVGAGAKRPSRSAKRTKRTN